VFNVGPEKLLLHFNIALIVLGPSRLPDAARGLGRALGEFRRVSGRLQDEVRDALADPKDALSAAVSDLRNEFGDVGAFGLGSLSMTAPVGEQPPPEPSADLSPSAGTAPPAGGATAGSLIPPPPDDPSLN
jgi:sec-independent protein translocase protein TatB